MSSLAYYLFVYWHIYVRDKGLALCGLRIGVRRSVLGVFVSVNRVNQSLFRPNGFNTGPANGGAFETHLAACAFYKG